MVVAEELTQIQLSLASAEALVRRVFRRRPSTKSQLVGWRARHLSLPRYRIQSVLVRKPA